MKKEEHWAIFIDNASGTKEFIDELIAGNVPTFIALKGLQGALFSKLTLIQLIDEESRHGKSGITYERQQSLQSMSSGEQKKVLLDHLLRSKPDFLVLYNPFDNLDVQFLKAFRKQLSHISENITIIQIISRKDDLLPFITRYAKLVGDTLVGLTSLRSLMPSEPKQPFTDKIPLPLKPTSYAKDTLITLKNVNVSYNEKPVLKNIFWEIGKGEFWELSGNNGSGKTTILSMITGENPKGYGQELYLFGHKKGSGESVWDIKKNIGYFTPSMTDTFTGYHSLEHMMISGILDSVGLYVRPTEAQLRLAKAWLQLIGMWHLKDTHFHDLTLGQKRLVMTTRAMVKHPPLLLLDEPTVGLDDTSAALLVSLVNKIAKESKTSIIYVSHR
ncbi:MAG: ATP-binding cassette domain-containing protein, partial [Maribacter sp.]|uniref:ATP-binding cassette domain-containing protein n=1 Tax=Maribacter sp. TaxID=1897614 RepID=UPI003C7522F9